MLTRNGLVIDYDEKVARELTVRPVENALGMKGPSFKVWRRTTDGRLLVPRHFRGAARDARKAHVQAPNINFVGKLRDETRQNEAYKAGLAAFDTCGGGVLSLPPGFGKTTMALAFAGHLKVRTLIVVHKEFLANQWRDRIGQFCPGATIGRIQQDVCETDCDFVIALIQTLCMRPHPAETFDQFGFLIVDEAHHIGAAAFSQSMFKCSPKWTLGLTATPERKDGLTRVLYWFLGPEFFRVQRENQKATKVETIFFDDPAFREAPPVTRFGKINMAGMTTLLTELNLRNELILKISRECLQSDRKVLILTDRREHCQYLQSELGSKIAGLYYGGMKEIELDASSRMSVIVATFSMAQEGLDIPVLDTVILATPHSDITQAVGRIMRETPGKTNTPLIYDISDRWSVFHSMYRKRLAIYTASGFEIATVIDDAVFGKGKCMIQM